MESIKKLIKNKPKESKLPAHRFQDLCLKIIEDLSLPKDKQWLVWRLWNKGGFNMLNKIKTDIKEGVVKNPEPYLFWLFKQK